MSTRQDTDREQRLFELVRDPLFVTSPDGTVAEGQRGGARAAGRHRGAVARAPVPRVHPSRRPGRRRGGAGRDAGRRCAEPAQPPPPPAARRRGALGRGPVDRRPGERPHLLPGPRRHRSRGGLHGPPRGRLPRRGARDGARRAGRRLPAGQLDPVPHAGTHRGGAAGREPLRRGRRRARGRGAARGGALAADRGAHAPPRRAPRGGARRASRSSATRAASPSTTSARCST